MLANFIDNFDNSSDIELLPIWREIIILNNNISSLKNSENGFEKKKNPLKNKL